MKFIEMEKICEFCTSSRPVVYCTSDAANLCLSCDAKVHSANALSSRHFRTLLCDSCRCRPSYVRCLEHRMFMCSDCDSSLHDVSDSQHQRRGVSSYLGCPSAKDFAALWGFELNEQENKGNDVSSSQETKVILNAQQQQSNSFILQQILDLKRLQVTEGGSCRPLISGEEQIDTFSSIHRTVKNFDAKVGQSSHNFQRDDQIHELEVSSFSLPFTHLEHLSSSSNAGGLPLQGESFWQSNKSPIQSNQLWSQTMQDLGVCEDTSSRDDFNMPDVDLTFRNFEEVFGGGGGNQDPIQVLLDDNDNSCSSAENEMSFDNTNYGNARPVEDASAASIYSAQSAQMERDRNNYQPNFDFSHPIQPPYSTMSFTLSRFSNESSGADFQDSELSPVSGWETSFNSPDLDGVHTEARENAMMRYKEKKKARQHDRQVRFASQKAKSDIRKKIKG